MNQMEVELKKAKYIVWTNYGYAGWHPFGFDTLKEAIEHDVYGNEKVITAGLVDFEVKEIK